MPTTRLADAIVPEIFSPYENNNTMENFRLFQSGALVSDSQIARQLNGGGRLFQTPAWRDLDKDDPNIGSDDPAQLSTPKKLGSLKDQSVRHNLNQSWASMRLTRELAGSNPMKRIASRISEYWNHVLNTMFIKTMNGVIASNVANNGGDMVLDISGGAGDAGRFSAEAFIDARSTLGDAASQVSMIMVHSQIKARMDKLDLIDVVKDSDGKIIKKMYLEHELIESDTCFVDTSGSEPVYWCYLLGPGAFAWAQKALPANEATEVEPKPDQGNGQGGDIIYSRKQVVMHPYGVKWTDAVCAGESPTFAELENPANWERVYPERKQLKMAVLKVHA